MLRSILNEEKQRRRIALALVVALFAALVVVVSRNDAPRAIRYALHDSGIWATRRNEPEFPLGRVNRTLQAVDMRPDVVQSKVGDEQSLDVVQSDANVVMFTNSAIAQVSVPQSHIATYNKLPEGAQVAMGTTLGAVLDGQTGRLWIGPGESLGTLTSVAKPVHVPHGSLVVAGKDDTIYTYKPATGELRIVAGGRMSQKRIPAVPDAVSQDLTVVGTHFVVLDQRRSPRLVTDAGRSIGLSDRVGAGAVLQQPSDAAGAVLVSSPSGLYLVPFSGGRLATLADGRNDNAVGGGVPAQPVTLRGCYYGAWQTTGNTLQVCPDASVSRPLTPARFTGQDSPKIEFRVNHQMVIANEVDTGDAIMWVDGRAVHVDHDQWDQAFTDAPVPNSSGPGGTGDACRTSAAAPIADSFTVGTRPGRAITVPVMRHVRDPLGPGCRVLAVDLHSPVMVDPSSNPNPPEVVDDGQSILYTPVTTRPGSESFEFTVSGDDGRVSKPATVTVDIVGDTVNKAPEFVAPEKVPAVQTNGTWRFNVLTNATDPENDPVTLSGPPKVAGATRLSWAPDGDVSFTAPNHPANLSVVFSAKDDRVPAKTSNASTLKVAVVTAPVKPQTSPVVAYTSTNAIDASTGGTRDLVIDVLAHDRPGSGSDLTLLPQIAAQSGHHLRVADNKVVFTPTAVDDFTATYTVTDGLSSAAGKVRIVVLKGGANHPPIAVPVTVRLNPDGTGTANLLASDIDIDDDVLFVTGVDAGDAQIKYGLRAQVVNHSSLRITAPALPTSVIIHYSFTDGNSPDVNGTLLVLPPTPAQEYQYPIARSDNVTVRVRGFAAISPLGNDTDPQGDQLTLAGLQTPSGYSSLDPTQGSLTLHGDNTLRYAAPAKAQSVKVLYTVTNAHGLSSAATLVINVVGSTDPENPPDPPTLIARVFAGQQTKVSIPVFGIDPESDPVRVLGLETPPTKGVLTQANTREFVYRADDTGGGTDRFTYQVEDALGHAATGTVLVAIAPRPLINTPPIAQDDAVRARAGWSVNLQVLANDSDADGDALSIASAADAPRGIGNAPHFKTDGTVLSLLVPASAKAGTQYHYTYSTFDGISVSDQRATVAVIVDPKARDVPIAQDDVVVDPQTWKPDKTVDVGVLANDHDSGPHYGDGDLKIVALPPGATQRPRGVLRVRLRPIPPGLHATVEDFAYTIRNGDRHALSTGLISITVVDRVSLVAHDFGVAVQLGKTVPLRVLDHVADSPTMRPRVSHYWVHGGTARLDATSGIISFTAATTSAGYADVVYEVTDAAHDFAEGVAVITVNGPHKPVLTGTTITLNPGDPPRVVSLESLTSGDAASGARHTYREPTRAVVDRGITAVIRGGDLVVTADKTSLGRSGTLVVQATNDQNHLESDAATFRIQVRNPLPPRANSLDFGPFKQTQAIPPLDVLSAATDPEGHGLHLLGATLIASAGAVTFDRGIGGKLHYVPNPRFSGTAQILFTVADESGDPSRNTTAYANVLVVGPPLAPTIAPTVTSGYDSGHNKWFVDLDWSGGPAVPQPPQAAPIDYYEYRTNSGAWQQCPVRSAAPHCAVQNLVSGDSYSFQVRAVSSVGGIGLAGPATTSRTYDRPPFPPTNVRAAFKDGSTITVTWDAALSGSGSDVTRFEVQNDVTHALSPVPEPPKSTGSFDVGQLSEGVPYTFTVVAYNQSSTPSFSGPSNSAVPIGPPTHVQQPTVGQTPGQPNIDVSWVEPTANLGETGGDDPNSIHYTLGYTSTSDSGSVAVQPGTFELHSLQLRASVTYGITLVVSNAYTEAECQRQGSNPDACGVSSDPVSFTTYGAPPRLAGLTVTPGDRSAVVTFASVAPPRSDETVKYQLVVSPPGSQQDVNSGDTITGLTPDTAYTFALDACTVAPSGLRFCTGDPVAQANVKVYGPPSVPTGLGGVPAGGQYGTSITWSWNTSSPGCESCAVTGYNVTGVGGASGSPVTHDYGDHDVRHCAQVEAISNKLDPNTNQPLKSGLSAEACAVTPSGPPTASVNVTEGAFHTIGTCDVSYCHYVTVSTINIGLNYGVALYENWIPGCTDPSRPSNTNWLNYTATKNPSNYGVFGYPGCQIWAVVNGHKSNVYVWPNTQN